MSRPLLSYPAIHKQQNNNFSEYFPRIFHPSRLMSISNQGDINLNISEHVSPRPPNLLKPNSLNPIVEGVDLIPTAQPHCACFSFKYRPLRKRMPVYSPHLPLSVFRFSNRTLSTIIDEMEWFTKCCLLVILAVCFGSSFVLGDGRNLQGYNGKTKTLLGLFF